MEKNKILLAEPKIKIKDTIQLTKKVLTGNFPNEGKFTRLLEKKISKLLKVKYAVAVTSGTASIFLALKAIGIKKDDEVIVPNVTFPATANAVSLSGAKVALVDIDKKTLLIDEDKLLKKINNKTRAIIPVHVSGRGSNIKEVIKIAKNKKLHVVEDSAEAFMSKIDNKYLGTFGDVGCFSFSPPKIITTGQGGALVTNNKSIYRKILQLKNQGREGSTTGGEDNYISIGYNFKYTDLQAAMGLVQLKNIKKRINILKKNYQFYKKNLNETKKFKLVGFNLRRGEVPLWTDVFSSNRNQLYQFLKKEGISCRFFWHPLNTCKPYKQSFSGLKNSKDIRGKLMWIPSSLNLKKKDLIKICNKINKFNLKNE